MATSSKIVIQKILDSKVSPRKFPSFYTNSKSIFISARFNYDHYGYYSDLIQGPQNTAIYSKETRRSIIEGPVKCQFISGDEITSASSTQSSNIDSLSRIFSPYVDGQIPKSAIGREDYILQSGEVAI